MTDHRKTYARGFYDALRQAGIETEGMTMNQAKFDAVHKGLTAQAKKVYDAIPISEPWRPAQIMKELHRRESSMSDMRVVMGCLNSLIDSGCVEEPEKGRFIRTEVRVKQLSKAPVLKAVKNIGEPPMQAIVATNLPTPSAEKAQTVGPIERLSTLASRLRELASDMETTALELAEQAEKNDTDTSKMRQLQALLKSLG